MKENVFILIMAVLILCAGSVAGAGFQSSSSGGSLRSTAAISVSLVNQDPDPANAGDVVEVRLGIQNIGGETVNNLVVGIEPEYPFALVSGESSIQEAGTIQGYQGYYDEANMKILKFKIRVDKDATAGSYELKVSYYQKDSQAKTVKSLAVDVKNRESAEVIHIDKSVLIPGKETDLRFVINNVGNAPLRDLSFSWVNGDKIVLPVGSDNTKYVKYLDIGKSAELKYTVIADSNADAGLYELALKLVYRDTTTGSESEIETIAGVYVGGGTDFDVAYSESSGSQMSFTIANIGSNPAYSVSVIIPQQSGWRTTGASSMIIGNLNTGDYTVASFNLQSTPAIQLTGQSSGQRDMQRNFTQGANSLNVQIAYTDTMGTRNTVEKELQLNQQVMGNSTSRMSGASQFGRRDQQSFLSKYRWYIVALVLLAGIVLVHSRHRKEKMKNPDFKMKDLLRKKYQGKRR
ncbi:COG1361 S-layer family protein [Candidatus Woesearchaeota archaeon]|nr:COG1361 S-layer family protein [Candidatus Woesearchaeota archaeon]